MEIDFKHNKTVAFELLLIDFSSPQTNKLSAHFHWISKHGIDDMDAL